MSQTAQELLTALDGQRIINTHCHHLDDSFQNKLNLESLLRNTYVSWCGVDFDETVEKRRAYFQQVRFNSYFHWLEIGLQHLYDLSMPLNESTWELFDERIKAAGRDPNHHLGILKNQCHYEQILLDAYWAPGSDNGHPELFKPVYRINQFLFGYSPEAKDHNGNNPFQNYHWSTTISLDEYITLMEHQIIEQKKAGCIALKSALAYDRGLDFSDPSIVQAQRGFQNPNAGPAEIKAFQNYVFRQLCRIAAEQNLPLQCHTGLGRLEKTNAMQMKPVIEEYPDTQFVLFHGGYPWIQDVCALVHNFPNVYADLCWLPILSGPSCKSLVREMIEIGTLDRMMWGCDTWTSEESYGAMIAAKQVLSAVFAEYVDDGYLSCTDAIDFMDHIFYRNPKEMFRL